MINTSFFNLTSVSVSLLFLSQVPASTEHAKVSKETFESCGFYLICTTNGVLLSNVFSTINESLAVNAKEIVTHFLR